MEEKEMLENTETMMRLKYKAKLIKDVALIFKSISRDRAALPKRFVRRTEISIMRDYLKGIRIINQRVPVFVELPNVEKKGEGMYTKQDAAGEGEIVVESPIVDLLETNKLEQIEA